MTQVVPEVDSQSRSIPRPPPAAGQPGPTPVMPLDYGRPARRGAPEFLDWVQTSLFVAGFRRLVMAVGAGLILGGVVEAMSDRYGGDASTMAGWGGALVVLVMPFPYFLRRRPAAEPPGSAGSPR